MMLQHGTRITAGALFTAILGAAALTAQTPAGGPRLEYVAILSRHGVRSPLIALDVLRDYSAQPWHPMDAPIGYLTPHGALQMQRIGAWDREYFHQAGIIGSSPGCLDAARFYFHADAIQRDIESARIVAGTMFPGCGVPIHSSAEGKADPMFLGADAPGLVDRELAGAALEARSSDPLLILKAHANDVNAVQKILEGDGPSPKKTLWLLPPPQGDRYTRATGPLSQVNNVTDALVLEYEQGYPLAETGWGRLNESNLPALLLLQEALVDRTWDNPVIARARGSDLLAHLLRSMQQAANGHEVEGALGHPGDRGLFVAGHDSDFGHIATLLNISWLFDGFPPKATQPGAAMMFEIWKDGEGHRTVRMSVVGQSMQQIREASALTPQDPPMKIAIFVPGCSTAAPGFPCEWDAFRRVVDGVIDSGQVRPEPAEVR